MTWRTTTWPLLCLLLSVSVAPPVARSAMVKLGVPELAARAHRGRRHGRRPRIANLRTVRRRSPPSWPRPYDAICWTRTPATPGTAATVHIAASSRIERVGSRERHARPDTPPPSIGRRTGPNQHDCPLTASGALELPVRRCRLHERGRVPGGPRERRVVRGSTTAHATPSWPTSWARPT